MSPQMNSRPLFIGLSAALIIALLDQLSKWWILETVMQPPRAIPVTGFFNLVLAWNRGISFGMFGSESDWGPWILSALAVVICLVLVYWLNKSIRRHEQLAFGLIIGGAIGNVIDRLRFSAVTDFLDFHLAGYHWPAFNVADSAIFVGAVILVIDSFFNSPKKA